MGKDQAVKFRIFYGKTGDALRKTENAD